MWTKYSAVRSRLHSALLGQPIAHVRLMPRQSAAQDWYSPEALAVRRGLDLRLLPVALLTWALVSVTVIWRTPIASAAALIGGLAAMMLLLHRPQARGARATHRAEVQRAITRSAATAGIVGGLISGLTWWRMHLLGRRGWGAETGEVLQQPVTVESLPRTLDDGGLMVTVSTDTMGPGARAPLFISREHVAADYPLTTGIQPGDVVETAFRIEESSRAGIVPIVFRATRPVEHVEAGQGLWAVSRQLRNGLNHAAQLMPGDSGMIVPGMVVGDTTAQPQLLQDQFLITGLSHLSAVSGANCAIVMGAAMVAASALGAGRWGRIIASATALVGFVAVVGPEPSVLRAAVMGSIGVVAVATSLWRDIVASACWAVLGLLQWDPDLAVNYGFLLSVVATVGIVVLAPRWSKGIMGWWWTIAERRGRRPPEWHGMCVRLLCVSVAADLVTAPLIMHMAGRYSVVAVCANILVSWAVPIVTIVGLILAFAGALAVPLGGASDAVLFCLGLPAAPGAGWVVAVARVLSRAPVVTAPSGTMSALVIAGLVVLIILGVRRRTRWARWVWGPALIVVAGLVRWSSVGVEYLDQPWQPPHTIDAHAHTPIHVTSDDEALMITPDQATLIINDSCGPPTWRPTITPAGIPVVYPCRNGTKIME